MQLSVPTAQRRSSARVQRSLRDCELTWANKDLVLDSTDEGEYVWRAADDPALAIPRKLTQTGIIGDPGTDAPNLLIHGDALHALRALADHGDSVFRERKQVSLVYIDPPFNKGQGFGHYADSLSHAVWLSMLRDRLEAVKPLLSDLASIWVHLDDAESHRARCVLDEVFGEQAFVSTIVWQKRTTRESRTAFSNNHDYIHVYAPAGPRRWKVRRNLLKEPADALLNRDNDPRGAWADAPFTAPGHRHNQHYEIVNPAGLVLKPPRGRSWYATQQVYQQLVAEGRIWFPSGGRGSPRLKRFQHEIAGVVPYSIWSPTETGTNDDATRHLMGLLHDREPFATPKPEELIRRIVHIASEPGDLVLDFFAGSGTTAAVAQKMRRRWIAVECSGDVIDRYALPRLERVLAGSDPGGITDAAVWTGGGAVALARVSPTIEAAVDVATPTDVRAA